MEGGDEAATDGRASDEWALDRYHAVHDANLVATY